MVRQGSAKPSSTSSNLVVTSKRFPEASVSGIFCFALSPAGVLALSVTCFASSPKGTPLSYTGNFAATTEAVPLGKVAKPQALTEGVNQKRTPPVAYGDSPL